MSEYQSKSELYAAHQHLFDEIFEVMMVQSPSEFQLLAQNDHLYEDEAELPEGTSLHWADGTPLPADPEENGHA